MLQCHSTSCWLTLLAPAALLTDGAKPVLHRQPLVEFLLGHAVQADASNDLDLSAAGNVRSALAKMLHDTEIEYVYSTDLTRTEETASPVAAARGVEADLYEVEDLSVLAKLTESNRGRHLRDELMVQLRRARRTGAPA